MPNYNVAHKLATRGFWFVFTRNERPTVEERYTFDAEVTIEGESGPLLTMDSTTHTFLYKKITEKGDEKYRDVPAKGLKIDDLPCIVAFEANLPPDRNATARARATDWKDGKVTPANKLNVQEFEDIAEVRMDFVSTSDTEPGLLLDIPTLPPVPIVLLEAHSKSDAEFCVKPCVHVYDWTGRTPTVGINGKALTARLVNKREVERADFQGYVDEPPVAFVWEASLGGGKLQPRLEVVASNGHYCGGAYIKYLAQAENDALAGYVATNGMPLAAKLKNSGTTDHDAIAAAFTVRADKSVGSSADRVLGESLPFAPPPKQAGALYGFRIRLVGEPFVSFSKDAPPLFMKEAGAQVEVGNWGSGSTWLTPVRAASPKEATIRVAESSSGKDIEKTIYIWSVEYRSRQLICVEESEDEYRLGRAACSNSSVIRNVTGSMLHMMFSCQKGGHKMLAGTLNCFALARSAGFDDRDTVASIKAKETVSASELRLRCYTWDSEGITLIPATGHTPGLKCDPQHALFVSGGSGVSLRFNGYRRVFYGQSTYLHRYGCEQHHPVRLWQYHKRPTKEKYSAPLLSLGRAQMIKHFANATTSGGIGVTEPWLMLYRVYLAGHLHGHRLGHPSPDEITILFDGWPGIVPTFLLGGLGVHEDLTLPDHGNLCKKGRRPRGNHIKFVDDDRYSSAVNRQLRKEMPSLSKKFHDEGPTLIWRAMSTVYQPMIALHRLVRYLKAHPEVEAVSLGGYSIGTSRALWLAQILADGVDVWLPRSTTLEKAAGIRPCGPTETPRLSETYRPYAFNKLRIQDFLGEERKICVNNLLFMDFNFGACTFLPYTQKFTVPDNVRQVHHINSIGALRSGRYHYRYIPDMYQGIETVGNMVPGMASKMYSEAFRHARKRRFACHKDRLKNIPPGKLPRDIVSHTKNLWLTYETRLSGVVKHYPKALGGWKVTVLKDLIEKEIPEFLEKLQSGTLVGICKKAFGSKGVHSEYTRLLNLGRPVEEFLPLAKKAILEFIEWLITEAVKEAIDDAIEYAKNVIEKLIMGEASWWIKLAKCLVDVVNRFYWMSDLQMLFAYGEDGIANSSGAGFIYKSTGMNETTKGVGLLKPGASYVHVPVDHLEMGEGKGGTTREALGSLMGKKGLIR